MVPRYARPAMTAIWEPEARFRIWFEIEAHAATAMADIGVIPKEAAHAIWEKGSRTKLDTTRIDGTDTGVAPFHFMMDCKPFVVQSSPPASGRVLLCQPCAFDMIDMMSAPLGEKPGARKRRAKLSVDALCTESSAGLVEDKPVNRLRERGL